LSSYNETTSADWATWAGLLLPGTLIASAPISDTPTRFTYENQRQLH
jgi:hypothetical protein